MFLELGIIAAAIAQDAHQNYQIKKKGEQLRAQGAYLPKNEELHNKLFHDYWSDFQEEKGELVPLEFIPYFKINNYAARSFIEASVAQKEIRAGYQPCRGIATYDKNTFNALGYFYTNYLDKIETYNRTGVYYS